MIGVDTGHKTPIKIWVSNIEEGALNQAYNLADLPFVFKHIALMPDSHQGYGMPIGGVLATKGIIIPNAVGVDISCGVACIKTSLKTETTSIEQIKELMGFIRKAIPLGHNHHSEAKISEMEFYCGPKDSINKDKYPIFYQEYNSATHQIGTLGGGNHFIEIQKDPEGFIWVMIHSGSRNIGKKVADHYNERAKNENWRWFSSVPKEVDLAFLPLESEIGLQYFKEQQMCGTFAKANREVMLSSIMAIIKNMFPECEFLPIVYENPIFDIAHNYADIENHFGVNVIVHRKGATRAYEGQLGIIPGSQGTKSYIVRGLGNPDSFKSCSHGAGRKMGRKVAQQSLNLQDEIDRMNSQGIVHSIRSAKDLDEAAGAYKDIDEVMENQKDLVEIVTELKPIAVIKA